MRPAGNSSRLRGALLALALLAALALAVVAAPSVGLILAPPLVLFLVLAVGLFPGEDVLARARERRMRRRPVRAPRRVLRPVLAELLRPAGNTLAYALAMRPPPAAA